MNSARNQHRSVTFDSMLASRAAGASRQVAVRHAFSAPAASTCLRRHLQVAHTPSQLRCLASTAHPTSVKWLHSITDTDGRQIPAPPTTADAIVILAGGQTDTGSGLPAWVERRLDTCLDLQKLQAKPCPILCLGGGTPHKPPILNSKGYVIHEATGCADYLLANKCDPTLILKEVSSYDTVGNAFFSLTIHAIPAGWRNVLVVTSDFHMPRTRALFKDMYGMAARDVLGDPDRFSLAFASSSDDGLFDKDVLEARHSKEADSVRHWQTHQFKHFSEIHWWLHQTHQCYAVGRQHEFDRVTIADPRLLASY